MGTIGMQSVGGGVCGAGCYIYTIHYTTPHYLLYYTLHFKVFFNPHTNPNVLLSSIIKCCNLLLEQLLSKRLIRRFIFKMKAFFNFFLNTQKSIQYLVRLSIWRSRERLRKRESTTAKILLFVVDFIHYIVSLFTVFCITYFIMLRIY